MNDAPSGWLAKLRGGLGKTSSKLSDGITAIFTKRALDAEALDALQELLIAADMGVATSQVIIDAFSEHKFDKDITPEAIKEALAGQIADMLRPVAKSLQPRPTHQPFIVLVVGVNGNGKTTTIGKLAMSFVRRGHSTLLAAGDTFRAAAVEQLKIWGERTACPVVSAEAGADPASVVYTACERAKIESREVLLIDTAGRLQNKNNLMAELQKTSKVIKRIDSSAPHEVILVLDATTGQNALSQVETFKEMVGVTGLVVTKLDGTARGGIVVALAHRFGLPIYAIGVGEGIEDLRNFDAEDFARSLVGL